MICIYLYLFIYVVFKKDQLTNFIKFPMWKISPFTSNRNHELSHARQTCYQLHSKASISHKKSYLHILIILTSPTSYTFTITRALRLSLSREDRSFTHWRFNGSKCITSVLSSEIPNKVQLILCRFFKKNFR